MTVRRGWLNNHAIAMKWNTINYKKEWYIYLYISYRYIYQSEMISRMCDIEQIT